VSASSWTPYRLAERLRDALAEEGPRHIGGDEVARPLEPARLRPAAVLIALVERPGGPSLVLTRRAAHLKAHAGQTSLPGGRMEPEDVSAVATALRESEEEIGLPPDRVAVLGGLRSYDTITGFRIHPVVGWVADPPAWRAEPAEVAEIFEVPLAFVLDPANHTRESYLRDGQRRYFYVLPHADHYIWGATAGILVNFARLLRA
jgi:8-oxo-dGTP pyrophosphatase MutT (NUDIX family)